MLHLLYWLTSFPQHLMRSSSEGFLSSSVPVIRMRCLGHKLIEYSFFPAGKNFTSMMFCVSLQTLHVCAELPMISYLIFHLLSVMYFTYNFYIKCLKNKFFSGGHYYVIIIIKSKKTKKN